MELRRTFEKTEDSREMCGAKQSSLYHIIIHVSHVLCNSYIILHCVLLYCVVQGGSNMTGTDCV
jgi:hypothetical protein